MDTKEVGVEAVMVDWHLDRISHWLDMTGLPAQQRQRWARQELGPLLTALALESPARQAEIRQRLSYLAPQLLTLLFESADSDSGEHSRKARE